MRARALASRPAKVDRLFGDGLGRRSGAIGLDHHQARVVEEFLRLYLRFLVPRFLAPRLFVPQFFASWFVTPRFFMARLRVHRLGVLRLLLALRLELMDAPLRLDHGRVDMRRRRVTALATPIAIAIASAAAAPPAPRLVAVALGTRRLGARIAGVRARVLDRGLSLAFSQRLRRLLRTGLLPLLLRTLTLRPAVRARTAIGTAIVPLAVASSVPLRLTVSALLEATLLLAIAAAVLVAPAVASIAPAAVAATVASTVAPAVTAIAPMLLAVVALRLLLRTRCAGWGCGRRRRRLRGAE